MPSRGPSRGRPQGVYVVRLNDHELTAPGARIQLTLGWLTQNATVDGEGILDSMVLASKGPHITAYFDQAGAVRAEPSCLLFPQGGQQVALAGPVVVACFGAESQTEATVQTAQVLSILEPRPEPIGPHIHPTWPTVQ